MSKNISYPVYEFRPILGFFKGPIRRYAEGKWLEDDGEYDLAFINSSGFGVPICLMVELPYQKNITWSWLPGHWQAHDANHRNHVSPGNPWHYMLRDGAKDWGGDWGRDRHQNYFAGRAGMDKVCSERGCANGRHVEFHLGDPHIAAGLLRRADTKEIVTFPDNFSCMYCGDKWREHEAAASQNLNAA